MGVETRYYIKQHVTVKVIKCIREDVNDLWANYSPVQDKTSLWVTVGNSRSHLKSSSLEVYSFYLFIHSNRAF